MICDLLPRLGGISSGRGRGMRGKAFKEQGKGGGDAARKTSFASRGRAYSIIFLNRPSSTRDQLWKLVMRPRPLTVTK